MYSFLGAVNTYWLMWSKQAHFMDPLPDKSGKKTLQWTLEMDNDFHIMKTILDVDVLMVYHNKTYLSTFLQMLLATTREL